MLVSGLVGGLGLGGGKVVAFMVAPMTGLPALRVANQEWSARGRISATSTDSSSSQSESAAKVVADSIAKVESAAAKVSNESAAKVVAESTRGTRHLIRDAIWKATDSIAKSVEEMPERKVDQSIQRLGVLMDRIDDTYFAKYRGSGAGLNSVASAATSAGQNMEGKASGENVEGKASDKASSVGSTASKDIEKATTAAKNSVKKSNSGASGTVRLDRPKQVQGVFDELQKKAVEMYKSNAVGKSGSSASSPASLGNPLPPALEKLESELESLLSSSKFQPKALTKDKRAQLVAALKAMEEGYPDTASPLGDSALPGDWSMVYCSSGNLVSRVLKGALSKLFKVSAGRQQIVPRTSTVVDSCRARLRLTWFAWRVRQTGTYRMSATGGERANRRVEVTYREKKGFLRWMLPSLMGGKVQSEVTYLSTRWRICRSASGNVAVAFRKVNPPKRQ